jgi:hypothetical protein
LQLRQQGLPLQNLPSLIAAEELNRQVAKNAKKPIICRIAQFGSAGVNK